MNNKKESTQTNRGKKTKPKNIKNWFAQNVNYKHPNLIPLPIGLENHEGPSKGGSIDLNTLQKFHTLLLDMKKPLDSVSMQKPSMTRMEFLQHFL